MNETVCNFCKEKAITKLVISDHGRVESFCFCQTHLMSLPRSSQDSILDNFKKIITDSTHDISKTHIPKEALDKRCPGCGSSVIDLLKSGVPNCEICIYVHGEYLGEFIGDSADRVVLSDEETKNKQNIANKILNLHKQLDYCVGKEDFVTAAKIRDQIDLLREKYDKFDLLNTNDESSTDSASV